MKKDVPEGFLSPTALPQTPEQAKQWQEINRGWWETHPMRYDWKDQLGIQEFSKDFFLEIDNRFFSNAWEFMPWQNKPFDQLIDYPALPGQDVLEIGVGAGSHAGLLAAAAKSFTGIDLTDNAVKCTTERMGCFGLPGKILRMDVEQMSFADRSFDLVWSWGVIHHSSNTRNALAEIRRVLRPGGRAVLMVYHRNFWNYYIFGGLFHGILQGDLLKTGSLHQSMQRSTDGALARYYTVPEWNRLVSEFLSVDRVLVFGSKAELVPLPHGRLKHLVMNRIPNRLSAFLTNTCRLGSFVVATAHKSS